MCGGGGGGRNLSKYRGQFACIAFTLSLEKPVPDFPPSFSDMFFPSIPSTLQQSIVKLRQKYRTHMQPLRPDGDIGMTRLVGPTNLASMTGTHWRRMVRVMGDLFNPISVSM